MQVSIYIKKEISNGIEKNELIKKTKFTRLVTGYSKHVGISWITYSLSTSQTRIMLQSPEVNFERRKVNVNKKEVNSFQSLRYNTKWPDSCCHNTTIPAFVRFGDIS
jgi:hypothetical protein